MLGVPIALKDNILRNGSHVTAGSKILEGYTATYDATVVTKLKDAGAVFLGRANCDEFAMGSSTEKSAWGTTKNPHDIQRVPGGSSGGSAAAVAMHGAVAALGSDTGGSIRQPAAFCGVVGLKPTYGSVSRNGLIAMGSSLDVIGPFTKTVADAEILFNTIRGHDLLDSTTVPDALQPVFQEKKSYTIGVPRVFVEKGLDPDVKENFEATLKKLEAQGHTLVDVELPTIGYSLATYYVLMPAEASTNLARFDGVRFGLHVSGQNRIDDYKKTRGAGFGPEVRRRILLGAYVLSAGYYDAYYSKAMQARKKITDEFKNVFTKVDVIATPTTPTPAFTFGAKSDPLSMYLEDIFTVPANIAGIPAISVPSGTTQRDGSTLPLGIQFMASHMNEQALFSVSKIVTDEQ
jgi:aspartyl-tRNA(Asn)/glutamyl-tRNA(Gln) amidotransferase subunit A